jgi:predicted transcriptional regulator
MKSDILPEQLRAARALLDWSREKLRDESGVTARTLARIEAGEVVPHSSTMNKIRTALEAAGVRFIPSNDDGAGVRLRRTQ